MNLLEKNLLKLNPGLHSKLIETKDEVNLLLTKFSHNFPDYTDHSINHTLEVFSIASDILSEEEIEKLNADEIYILSMACLLHDIGMCIPENKIQEIYQTDDYNSFKESHPNWNSEDYIRGIHHQLSNKFILEEWELLKIASFKYAKAIGIVAEGHRKVDLGNFDVYDPHFFAKSGKEYVCLPYLACILRVADELDVTNSRTPKILTKYYMPNNEVSIREWQKHIATSQRNYIDNKVIFEVDCSDQNIYAALQDQFEKIQDVINYCQKIKRSIPFKKEKKYELNLSFVDVKYNLIGFDPKGIRFSFDVQNVVTAFIGEDLYKDKLTSLREAIQNSIDSCRFKTKVLGESYTPCLKIFIDDKYISIEDNGAGMDEFIIENYFGRLASSFYEQEKIKNQFEAIGQFGVGVFSYFLLSEYIDIETKSSKSDSLKFRFDKDPKSYFHFYDKTERLEVGTTITMHLKKELQGKLSFSKIEQYVRAIFKHIEIPIEVAGVGNQSIIEYQLFEINEQKEINSRIKLQHKKESENLKCIQVKINDEDIEGNCALIITKDPQKPFVKYRNHFDHEHFKTLQNHRSFSQISISQKGVFVNNYSGSLLNLIIGDFNIKKKVKINIDRNEFTDENQICSLINRFEVKLLRTLFNLIKDKYKDASEFLNLTNNFFLNSNLYWFNYSPTEDLISFFKEFLFFKVYVNNSYEINSLKILLEMYPEFILSSDKEDIQSIYNYFNKPIIVANEIEYYENYNSIRIIFVNLLKLTPNILMIDNKAYEFLSKDKNDAQYENNRTKIYEIIGSEYCEIVKVNSNKLLIINLLANKDNFDNSDSIESLFYNYNHDFMQYIIMNFEKIQGNVYYRKIIRSTFRYIFEIINNEDDFDLNFIFALNEIIKPLTDEMPWKEFTREDFY